MFGRNNASPKTQKLDMRCLSNRGHRKSQRGPIETLAYLMLRCAQTRISQKYTSKRVGSRSPVGAAK